MKPPVIEPDWPAPARVVALTTTRIGGCSRAPFHNFNLAQHVGDDPLDVAANRTSLQKLLPAGASIQWLSQVHGNVVVEAGDVACTPAADGVWTSEPGLACAVLTADCLPVLFCDRDGTAVAAAHAGWRGLLAGVLECTVNAMGVDPGRLLVWLGPAIGPPAFEVGEEVRAAFLAAAVSGADSGQMAACFTPGGGRSGRYFADRYFADLYALAKLRLRSAGVTAVTGGNYCTWSDPQRFFSYRRDGRTGRMASLIMLRPL